jgi:SPP1 family predicted phage head-tail adaptor
VRAGKLRHAINIEKVTITQDAVGGQIETWNLETSEKAQVLPVSGREYFQAQKLNTEVTKVFKIRYSRKVEEISPKGSRVVYCGKKYDILSIIDIDEMRKSLNILCKSP